MSGSPFRRTGREWFSSLPVCILLLAVVIFSTSSDIHNQMLRMGEHFWSGYYKLRADPVQPTCNPDRDIDAAVAAELAAGPDDDDPFADLLGAVEKDPVMVRRAIERQVLECQQDHADYQQVVESTTTGVVIFRTVELFVADLIAFGLASQRFMLIFLVMLCAATATLTRHHIAMRAMETRTDYRVSYTLQTVANLMLLSSTFLFRQSSIDAGNDPYSQRVMLQTFWVLGFAGLTLASAWRLARPPADLQPGGSIGKALLAVPLYTHMCFVSGGYFIAIGHTTGVGIYLGSLMELSDMFLNVALYVWVGMMLKQTRMATLVFNVFRPWRMPPELLAVVAVLVAAVPTAYTGASGIFVIAAGAVIYSELRAAGARRHLALAATAMSGSLGVVLRPCLLIVVIAYLNREVTTDELFSWGIWVFVLTFGMFAVVAMSLNRQNKVDLAPASEAFPAMLRALKPLLPYALVLVGVTLLYRYALNVRLDEFSAPRLLPVMMLGILVYEHVRYGRRSASALENSSVTGEITEKPEKRSQGLEKSVRTATNDTTAEIGALLLLLGLSVSIGGVIERAHIMEMFPQAFDSPWAAMLLLVGILVVTGMIMEAFGAVILVSATVASIAYASGIHPIHFWMVVLVAFELGYLSPPVALNHLLTRQVVGEAEVKAAIAESTTFYERYERIIMPLIAMGISLILVAFVPLLFYA